MKTVRIGSRESLLALAQTRLVADWIQSHCGGIRVEIVPMKTSGDKVLDRPLEAIGGKGLFVRELDQALLDGRTDLSVHSLKDLPMETPEALPLLGFSSREDPRDALVLPEGAGEWDKSRPVGCASRRRALQLQRLFPGVETALVRGNVNTRLRKLDEGQYGAILLAAAGLKRLGLDHRIFRVFSPEEMLPAAGQGILAVQGRAEEDYGFLSGFFDRSAGACARAERAFVRALGGGCSAPTAAYGELREGRLLLRGMFCRPDGSGWWTGELLGDPEAPEALGLALAQCWKEEAG